VLLITPLYLSEPFAYYYRGSLTVSSWNPGEQAHSLERAAQAEARRGRIWHISRGPVDLPQSMAGGRIEKWEFSQTESSVTLYLRDFGADVGTTLPAPASAMRDR
jgi:hypothetical protein